MKVVSGRAKGLPLKVPKSLVTRPTGVRVREAIFSILMADIEGADFYDPFAGSGGMGIEALSRGARSATFVEMNPDPLHYLRLNLQALSQRLGLSQEGTWRVVPKSVGSFLQNPPSFSSVTSSDSSSFSIVWADPPYDQGLEWIPKIFQALQPSFPHVLLCEVERRVADLLIQLPLFEGLKHRDSFKFKRRDYGSSTTILQFSNDFSQEQDHGDLPDSSRLPGDL